MTRSVRIHEFGGPDVLRIEDVVLGEPGAGEVRLRIHAVGLNRTELTLRSGRSRAKPTLPSVIGFEAAGVIEALGTNVSGFSVGDRVAVIPTYSASRYGFYGEVSLAPARSLVPIPDAMGFVEAAAIWVAFGTAWTGLVSVGALAAGQSVAISAASSSVGLAAVQIANLLGARPIALTRTSKKAQALLDHGAMGVVAMDEQDIDLEMHRHTGGAGAHLVFDAVGGPGFAALAKSTIDGGTLVLYGALDPRPTEVAPFDVFGRNLIIRGAALPAVAQDDQKLAQLKRFINDGLLSGSLRPTIARTFSFDDVAAAHRFIESGEQIGKIVLTV